MEQFNIDHVLCLTFVEHGFKDQRTGLHGLINYGLYSKKKKEIEKKAFTVH